MHNGHATADSVTSDDAPTAHAPCIKSELDEWRELLDYHDRSWLCELLASKGASQAAIAKSLRVSQATVSRDLALRRRLHEHIARLEAELDAGAR
jgi:hypothetical protein